MYAFSTITSLLAFSAALVAGQANITAAFLNTTAVNVTSSNKAIDGGALANTSYASSSAVTHVVEVGKGGLTFNPPQLQAAVGDMVQFQFWPKNHSVAQAAFANPCAPIPAAAGVAQFWSGFMPVSNSSTSIPTYTILVNSTTPLWFYCSQGDHCQSGMVGVINPTSNKTLEAFKASAAKATENLSPGQVPVTGANGTVVGANGTVSGTTGGRVNSTSANGTIASSSTGGAGHLNVDVMTVTLAVVTGLIGFSFV
ncbi:Cupredoxin [Saitoella complicata NRRL Y-17804]|nr:Cupredoxin [Saitoella complicata NRRL Y-17804]ODQ54803.1 Cupredoxin [Saitoella complicata NRRL Y-17804]